MKKLLFALLLASASVSSASACSLCIAHAWGGGIFGLGAQNLKPHTGIFGISTLGFTKTNESETPGVLENEVFRQTSLEFSYGLGPRTMLRASLPTVHKSLTVGSDPSETASGLGDFSIGSTIQFPPKPEQKFLMAFSFDVKLPTGSNNAKDETGARKEEHLQLGSGSTDVIVGVAFTGEVGSKGDLWFGGLRQRVNGTNSEHFHYGNVTLYSAGYSHALSEQAQAILELNGRIADKDKLADGSHDDNSGGHLGYLSASYRQTLGPQLGLIATYQQPVLKQLHGTQDEKGLFTLSLTRGF